MGRMKDLMIQIDEAVDALLDVCKQLGPTVALEASVCSMVVVAIAQGMAEEEFVDGVQRAYRECADAQRNPKRPRAEA